MDSMHPKTEQCLGNVMNHASGFFATLMAMMGDRRGLFRAMAGAGPLTSVELAERTGLDERYVREWLHGVTCAGYVDFDAATGRFELHPAHEPVLAEEFGPVSFGGFFQEMAGALPNLGGVIEAFETGRGVPHAHYGDEFWHGLTRFTGSWFDNMLLPVWVPAAPRVQQHLESGAKYADVGCGRGRAVLNLARSFGNSTFVGYDIYEPNVEHANRYAEEAGLAGRVRYEVLDASKGLPERYDVISTFDVVHDAVDPLGLMRSIREALNPDGVYLCLEINCSDRLQEMAGPIGTVMFGISLMYCMTTSLAQGGAGLGTAGLHETKMSELADAAGFTHVRRIDLNNPFNVLYELHP